MVVHSRDSQACSPVSQQSEAGAHEGRLCRADSTGRCNLRMAAEGGKLRCSKATSWVCRSPQASRPLPVSRT